MASVGVRLTAQLGAGFGEIAAALSVGIRH